MKRLVGPIQLRPVPSVAESAAKISRNRTLRVPFLRLIRDDGWNAPEDYAAELDSVVHRIVGSLLPNEQTIRQVYFSSDRINTSARIVLTLSQ